MDACKAQADEVVKLELIYDLYRERPDKKCSGVSCVDGGIFRTLLIYLMQRKNRDNLDLMREKEYYDFALYEKNNLGRKKK